MSAGRLDLHAAAGATVVVEEIEQVSQGIRVGAVPDPLAVPARLHQVLPAQPIEVVGLSWH